MKTKEALEICARTIARQGWDAERQREILLQYMGSVPVNEHCMSSLVEFMRGVAAAENEANDLSIGDCPWSMTR